MYFLLAACQNPDVLRIIYFVKLLIDVVFVVIPIGLIVLLMVDFAKMVIVGREDEQKKLFNLAIKRVIMAVAVFFVPTIVNLVNNMLADMGVEYSECLTNANSETIAQYQVIKEQEDKEREEELESERQDKIAEYKALAEEQLEKKRQEAELRAQISATIGSQYMTGASTSSNYEGGTGATIEAEPDPLLALTNLYNKTGNEMYNPDNYVAMKDKDNGYSLGAWPKTATVSNLPKVFKTYQNGTLIFPTTGDGSDSYDHNGIDIITNMGTPVYAPADGTLRYSEWGHTVNRGSMETAYSVSIKLDKPFSYTGQWSQGVTTTSTTRTGTVEIIYMTHMVGIKYRFNGPQIMKVKKGDLIGFTGIANNVSHLHMTFYDGSNSWGLYTPEIQKIYGITGSKGPGL